MVKSFLVRGFYLKFFKKVKCILNKMKIMKEFFKYSLKVKERYFLQAFSSIRLDEDVLKTSSG